MQREYRENSNPAAQNLYWMNGIESYLEHTEHPELEKFSKIKRAIMYGNPWAIQDLCVKELYRGTTPNSMEFFNLIFNQWTGYKEITHKKVLNFVTNSIHDEYIQKINHWSQTWGNKANLNEHFSRGQMDSKLWMVDKLSELFPQKQIPTIAHYGGWYATVAHHLFQHFEITNYWNLETDYDCLRISEDFNREQVSNNWQFKSIGIDVNDIYWRKDKFFRCKAVNQQGKKIEVNIDPDLIINTSCEHMSENWFEQIPEGKTICLQTNNYFSNKQHINCCENLEVALEKYPVQELYYSGQIETNNYTRYMIIGRK